MLFLFSCQTDDLYEEKSIEQNDFLNLTPQTVPFDYIEDVVQLKKELGINEINTNKSNSTSSLVPLGETGFLINTEQAALIEYQGDEYYTISLYDPDEPSKVINLLLSPGEEGFYKKDLIQYDLTVEERKKLAQNQAVDLKGKIGFIGTLNNSSSDNPTTTTMSSPCVEVIYQEEQPCAGREGHSYGEPCPMEGNDRATPATIIIDFTGCGGSGGGNNNMPGNGGGEPGNGGLPSPSEGGGGSSGGSGGGSPKEIPTTPVDKPDFYYDLPVELKVLWDFPSDQDLKNDVFNFLMQNGFSKENMEFATEALKAFNKGGEVDFVYKVIVDSTLVENECLYDIYEEMGKAPTFDNYLKNFDGDMSVANLKFSVGVDPDFPNANAVTIEPNNYLIEIMFNPNELERPSLDVARTFIHEMIHAEIYRILLSQAKQGNIPWSKNFIESMKDDYPGLYDYYMRFHYNLPNGVVPGDPTHEAMAAHYRGIIENAMKEFDDSFPQEIYDALSWGGLMGEGLVDNVTGLPPNPTRVWEDMDEGDRLNIVNIYDDFKENNPTCQE